MVNNFAKYSSEAVNTQNTPYDYRSVIHYGTTSFSVSGRPTIEPIQLGVTIGQRHNMSAIDILEVQLFYQCSGNGVTLTPYPSVTTGNHIACCMNSLRMLTFNIIQCSNAKFHVYILSHQSVLSANSTWGSFALETKRMLCLTDAIE
jgi:hypothetical protein